MGTKKISVYTIHELKARAAEQGDDYPYYARTPEGKAYAKALDTLATWNTSHEWWDSVVEVWKERLEAMGFEDVEIRFRGFGSQGDGASFTAGHIDLEKFIRGHYGEGHQVSRLLRIVELADVDAHVQRRPSLYVHENTVEVILNAHGTYGLDRVERRIRELENILTETVRYHSRNIYRDLEEDYEHHTSEETLLEFAEAAEYYFLEDGRYAPRDTGRTIYPT